ncbi:MAG: M28 family peptidase [Minisyncoccia bacterium]
MRKPFNHLRFIKNLIKFSPRQLEGETKAARFLISLLDRHRISHSEQRFFVKIPRVKKAILEADGVSVKCDGVSMVSGETKNGKYKITKSLVSPDHNVSGNNFYINYNPKCPVISNNNNYFSPAVSIAPKDLYKIRGSKYVRGQVQVEAIKHKAINILIGNTKNPKIICLAHYDSIKKGAIDNASGIAVIMGAILFSPEILKYTMFVLSGGSELSYEDPLYYGYGYRIFEKRNYKKMDKAEKIIAIDCVGYGETEIIKNKKRVELASPLVNVKKWCNKITIITGRLDKLMTVYHSDIDDGRYLKEKYLGKDRNLLIDQLNID